MWAAAMHFIQFRVFAMPEQKWAATMETVLLPLNHVDIRQLLLSSSSAGAANESSFCIFETGSSRVRPSPEYWAPISFFHEFIFNKNAVSTENAHRMYI